MKAEFEYSDRSAQAELINKHMSTYPQIFKSGIVDRLSLSWAITVFSLGARPDPDPEMIIQN